MIRTEQISSKYENGFLEIVRVVASRGDSYIFDETTTDEELADYWLGNGEVRIALHENEVVGGYQLRPNFRWRGSHIANAGYVVHPSAQGKGVGRFLCRDSVQRARELGYRGMQFNLVVENNQGAVGLWLSEGFQIIGTVPGVFRGADGCFVGAHVMFKSLTEGYEDPDS